jgi:hypothetical protein
VKVTLMIGAAHNMLAVLNRLERDPGLKLSPETQLAVAININRLLPDVQAYERARNRIYNVGGAVSEPAAAEADLQLRTSEAEFNLRMVKLADLKPNGQFVGGLSNLAPMVSDFPAADEDE